MSNCVLTFIGQNHAVSAELYSLLIYMYIYTYIWYMKKICKAQKNKMLLCAKHNYKRCTAND